MGTPIDLGRVRALAELARLELGDDELGRLEADLRRILEHVEQIGELALDDGPSEGADDSRRRGLRVDEPIEPGSADEALRRAPRSDAGHFLVPRTRARNGG